MLVNEYAKCFVTPDVRYINREEDVGDEGMRRSKESYHPVRLLEKYLVRIPAQPEEGETAMQEVYEFLKNAARIISPPSMATSRTYARSAR